MTYISGCGELSDKLEEFYNKCFYITGLYLDNRLIRFFETTSHMKIIVVNDKDEDVTDEFNNEHISIKEYLIKSKLCKYKYVDHDYEKKIERNDVHIYKTVLYPPKSKSQKIN